MFSFFEYNFLQNAFLAGTMLGVIAPLIGNFLVVKRYSALSDTLSHVSLLGVSIGLISGLFPSFSAIFISILVSLFLVHFKGFKGNYQESFLTLLMSVSLAGVAIITKLSSGFKTSLFSYLFGSLTSITNQNLLEILTISIVVILTIIICYKKILLICLGDEFAKLRGIKVWIHKSVLAILAAVVISFGIQIFGIMLMSAIIISPVITALQFSRSFYRNILYSICISLGAVWSGIVLSFTVLDLPTSSLIVMILFSSFILSTLLNKKN